MDSRIGSITIGTSGYAYPEWRGSFFPEQLGNEDFLPYYASHFSTVEINNTFYRFPSSRYLEQWAAQTASPFTFSFKANQRITHKGRLKNVGEIVEQFVLRCRELGPQLGAILFQLPPQLRCNLPRLQEFLAALPTGGRYAMEFRHQSWFDHSVLEALRQHRVALCVSDDGKLECPRTITADFSYVRLRRSDYSPAELESWRGWLVEQQQSGVDVLVYLKHEEDGRSPLEPSAQLSP